MEPCVSKKLSLMINIKLGEKSVYPAYVLRVPVIFLGIAEGDDLLVKTAYCLACVFIVPVGDYSACKGAEFIK